MMLPGEAKQGGGVDQLIRLLIYLIRKSFDFGAGSTYQPINVSILLNTIRSVPNSRSNN